MPVTSGHCPLSEFTDVTRDWFKSVFAGPTEVQTPGWTRTAKGFHSLLVAPTGSGKTLAAFLWAIDALVRLTETAAPAYGYYTYRRSRRWYMTWNVMCVGRWPA